MVWGSSPKSTFLGILGPELLLPIPFGVEGDARKTRDLCDEVTSEARRSTGVVGG